MNKMKSSQNQKHRCRTLQEFLTYSCPLSIKVHYRSDVCHVMANVLCELKKQDTKVILVLNLKNP